MPEPRSATFRMRLHADKLATWRAEAAIAEVTLTELVERAVDDHIAVIQTIRRNEERERHAAERYHQMDPLRARQRDWGRTR
jgi:3'-phosphoadenosine 5'-phosphosulfate sulfotransferase (PAPS reductase)/FAD synthetase